MKIKATLAQINDSIPFIKELVNKDLPFGIGYKLYTLSQKLDSVIAYLRDKITKEYAGLETQEYNEKLTKFLENKVEIDCEQFDRKEFLDAIKNLDFKPIAYSAFEFMLTEEPKTEAEDFKILED